MTGKINIQASCSSVTQVTHEEANRWFRGGETIRPMEFFPSLQSPWQTDHVGRGGHRGGHRGGPGFTSTEKVCLLVKEVPAEGPVQVTCDETVVHFVVRRDGEGRISVGGWQSLGPRARKRRPHHSANQAGNLWLERWLPEPDAWNLVCLKCFYFFAFSPKGLTPVKLLLEKHSTKPGGCG